MRSHPLAGVLFVLTALALAAAGALAPLAPFRTLTLPKYLPAEILVPFILWQLAIWALLLGVFFLRPRRRLAPRRT